MTLISESYGNNLGLEVFKQRAMRASVRGNPMQGPVRLRSEATEITPPQCRQCYVHFNRIATSKQLTNNRCVPIGASLALWLYFSLIPKLLRKAMSIRPVIIFKHIMV
jgi:hypothetical protein